ncbi:acetyl/propionyl-CoA carboxylase subuit alpha [Erwinia sp. OLTSP20]|uniref:acetyl/propionyl/methylcrotonyl-CoA carboxylase subunit alpha n=1 Tax=unclassified Erwinia TaxID=2622719 RepID=UPI000C19873D|nr:MULTISPECIES: biotin carboxylase N-terminal domain-containing protein [unclassified Erwinia]PIJ50721.1 acetyl/propionyl-CoA carboxylase subuit alpha [Erwinia sp. OAMSP11]PIJ75390.1 acetyl/propionyl-CoA carboxylase subuit alpha [Erwinia sp. OLSSP12]PIJ81888.1 acetyl/propionyl-CoA carboxylase subuit alpha [Erwinia sp. OLCASP19]PIJ84543.1 acetyl/propionyl-CoA carboxylase subuit alpha [Erwinia sp. OLMTSP26]PIJ86890.1 acetyl/propionyl-CoA carboxylase subuit alpha [Erwinia sp. OLMDSP33]
MKKVLIANRGEIAVRIIRACRDCGIASVAVYADCDSDALHVRLADEAWALPGNHPQETYLNSEQLIALAKKSGADAVHPGYGFLSEQADFAQAVIDAGLCWIGPEPKTIAILGDKVKARQLAQQIGAPLVAGTSAPVTGADEVRAFAEQHGLPVAIKAAHGGGGRGMKVVWRMTEVRELYDQAVREATAAFGRGECFVEQFLDRPRHIEAQILADRYGNVQVLGSRDCSLQRRNQKLIEEAPAPFLSDQQRDRIHQAAHDICAQAQYCGAGTVEFLLSKEGVISFLEVNTRLQVEHTVTEETTGIDLVVAQMKLAGGERLTDCSTPSPRGHAIEFRINAEDPARGFLPVSGTLSAFLPPSGPGIRLDSGVISGSQVPPVFDSLMAKLVVWGRDRPQALARARRALAEFTIDGVASVLPFHRQVLEQADFIASDGHFAVHTRWIETDFSAVLPAAPRILPPAALTLTRTFIEIDGRRVQLGLPPALLVNARHGDVISPAATPLPQPHPGEIEAPVAGLLQRWLMAEGARVNEGDILVTLDAMKMETPLKAPCGGVLQRLIASGEMVDAGTLVARIVAPQSQ